MAMQPVEWVLVIYYGPEAHRATYGRQVLSDRYTKDYIQLSRRSAFIDDVKRIFGTEGVDADSVPLTYVWPNGSTPGAFVFKSADRPHLKWETSLGAPRAWKMAIAPTEATAETIPGDPSRLDFASAENERALVARRGGGQPYLAVVKLKDQPRTLHLRVYLANPSETYRWADIQLAPQEIRDLADKTSQRRALGWSLFRSGGVAPELVIRDALSKVAASKAPARVIDDLDEETGRALADYVRNPGYGLFFDPSRNHDAWLGPLVLADSIAESLRNVAGTLEVRFPSIPKADGAEKTRDPSAEQADGLPERIRRPRRFGVEYQPADESASIAASDPMQVDPAIVERGNQAHSATQNALADYLNSLGITPRSPNIEEPLFDIGWESGGDIYVGEVKSITDANEESQLRLGLGQLLQYRFILTQTYQKAVQAVLISERKPPQLWIDVCASVGIVVAWRGGFEAIKVLPPNSA